MSIAAVGLSILLVGAAAKGPTDCEALLPAYGAPLAPEARVWRFLAETPAGGALSYYGAVHSSDPAARQVAEIKAAFAAARPTVVFYEGPDRGVGPDAVETVRLFGESGLARFLARESGARVARLEPEPVDEARAMLAAFPADQVFLFYVLREAAQLRERRGAAPEAQQALVRQMLPKMAALGRAAGVEPPFTDQAGLEAAFARYWPGQDWRAAPISWFDPRRASAETGGVFTNEINAASSGFRNVNMVRVLTAAARSGERVFAVVGRDHVAAQRAALACALAAPLDGREVNVRNVP